MKRCFLILLLVANISLGQTTEIKDLLKLIDTTKSDSVKVDTYNKLVWKYLFSDKEKAIKVLHETEKQALKNNQKYGYNAFLNNKGIYFDVNGVSDSAKIYFNKALAYSIKNNFFLQQHFSENNLGMYSWHKGKYQQALTHFFRSLALAEKKLKDNPLNKIDSNYNNIGLIYQELNLFEKAIPYHKKALAIRLERKNSQGEAASSNNLGICYKGIKKNTEAKKSFENGILKANEAQDKVLYYNNLQGLAQIYALENNNKKALNLYLESYNRPKEVPYNSNSKVKALSGITELYLELNEPKKAIEFGEICVTEINKEDSAEVYEVNVFNTLGNAYYEIGNIKKGRYYNDLFLEKTIKKFKDSNAKAIQELETKYETEKKEIALQKAKAENLLKEAEIKKSATLLVSALSLAFFLGLIGYLVYKQQRLKNRQITKESELKHALAEIENQNNLQEQRLAISKDLHDNIGSQLTFIISSLDNLKFFEFSKDILYTKFDTITGFTRSTITDLRDTIWAMNKETITFEDLKTRTTNFIETAKTSLLGIQFEFNYPESSEAVLLNSLQGIDVFRIIQESLNNAVKHAKATHIVVDFEVINNEILITIEDNGIGYNPATMLAGNGIASMKKRAKEIGGILSLESLEKGSKVSLKFAMS